MQVEDGQDLYEALESEKGELTSKVRALEGEKEQLALNIERLAQDYKKEVAANKALESEKDEHMLKVETLTDTVKALTENLKQEKVGHQHELLQVEGKHEETHKLHNVVMQGENESRKQLLAQLATAELQYSQMLQENENKILLLREIIVEKHRLEEKVQNYYFVLDTKVFL
jgi:chromosome segregation ATPase